jgi:GT2 family glycosyltransferase
MPLGYLVAEAQNIIVDLAVAQDFQWVFFLEDDVVLPVDAFIRLNEYMKSEEYPIVSGLYFIKCTPSEPIVYRGRGNSCFAKFKPGDLVWADGIPTGCLLVHSSVLKIMHKESEEYVVPGSGQKIRRVFETPSDG